MPLNLPLVSIVITNYNRQNTIARAISSALLQDYSNLEIIISDNCSTDNSHDIISRHVSDNRVRYYRNNENVGMLENFRLCFEERANGEFITIVNSDDELINTQFISQSIDLVLKYDNIGIVKSQHELKTPDYRKFETFDTYHEFYSKEEFYTQINFNYDFGWSGIFLNRKKINALNLFRNNVVSLDYIGNLLMLLESNIAFNHNLSYRFNVHENNASNKTYQLTEIDTIFKVLNPIFSAVEPDDAIHVFALKIKGHYFKSILQYFYINDRKDYKRVIGKLSEVDPPLLNDILLSKDYYFFSILYLFPKLGRLVAKIKKKLFPKSNVII